jgi:hypothetical protein
MDGMGGAGNRPSLSFYPLTLTTHYMVKNICNPLVPKGAKDPIFHGNNC